MRRDMDLIRLLLLKLESLEQETGDVCGYDYSTFDTEGYTSEQVIYHLDLMLEAGLIDQGGGASWDYFVFKRLTWAGHDLVDSIRDEEIWRKTKHGALAAGGWSLELLGDLAKGFIRKKVSELCGVDL